MTDQQRSGSDRFSLTLIPAALEALARIMKVTGLSRADSINRAIQVYGFIAQETQGGKALLLRDAEGNLERVHIV